MRASDALAPAEDAGTRIRVVWHSPILDLVPPAARAKRLAPPPGDRPAARAGREAVLVAYRPGVELVRFVGCCLGTWRLRIRHLRRDHGLEWQALALLAGHGGMLAQLQWQFGAPHHGVPAGHHRASDVARWLRLLQRT